MIIPIGHDESLRRIPWLTVGIMVVCALVQVRSCTVEVDQTVDLAPFAPGVAPGSAAGRHGTYTPRNGQRRRRASRGVNDTTGRDADTDTDSHDRWRNALPLAASGHPGVRG